MIGDRLPTRWLLWHGAGQAGQSVQGFALGFLFIYYNQVLGLPGTLAGLALAITSIVDAVTDPTVGSWSDGYRSRWGRRHPFLVVSVIPIGVLFVALFAPPVWLTDFQLFLWFTVVYSLMRTALTLYNVPYLALGAEVTQNYHERTRIASYRAFIGKVAALIVAAVGWNFVFNSTPDNPTPQLTVEPYLPFAIVSGVVMAAFMGASAWKTMDVIPQLPTMGVDGRRFHVRHIYGDLIEALRGCRSGPCSAVISSARSTGERPARWCCTCRPSSGNSTAWRSSGGSTPASSVAWSASRLHRSSTAYSTRSGL